MKRLSRVEDLPGFLEEFFRSRGRKVKVFLFGSRARGEHSPHSDVDIAILSNEDVRRDIIELKELLELSLLPQKVDVVDLNRAPEELRKEVLREGKLWIDLTGC